MFKFIKVHKFIKVCEFINLCLKIDLIHAEFFSLLFVLDFKDFALDSSYLFVCILTPALLMCLPKTCVFILLVLDFHMIYVSCDSEHYLFLT